MEVTQTARSSLEYGTKLVEPREARWRFVLYPEAAEGGGSFRSLATDPSGGDCSPTTLSGARLMRPAGAGQGPPVLRRQPAQPARDADLRRVGLP